MDIGDSVQNGFDRFFGFLPNLVGCLVILLIGYIIAKVVSAIVAKLLEKLGVDSKLQESQGGRAVDRMLPGASASRAIAKVLFWFVFAFFIVAAIGALHIDALTGFMNDVLAYLPNVIVAILIFIVAALIAGVAGTAASRLMGDTPTGRIVGTVVPALVMVIATFMILDQLKIAHNIVTIAFGATMFAIALGLALAFGLGGRDVARRMLEDAYAKGREQREQMRRDFAVGRERAEERYGDGYSGDSTGTYSTGTTATTGTTGTTGSSGTYGTGTTGGSYGTGTTGGSYGTGTSGSTYGEHRTDYDEPI